MSEGIKLVIFLYILYYILPTASAGSLDAIFSRKKMKVTRFIIIILMT